MRSPDAIELAQQYGIDMKDGWRQVWHIDATDTESGERWIVHTDTLYEAAVELAKRMGIELMD